jgi:membrane-bound lytic murein transglycosylase D
MRSVIAAFIVVFAAGSSFAGTVAGGTNAFTASPAPLMQPADNGIQNQTPTDDENILSEDIAPDEPATNNEPEKKTLESTDLYISSTTAPGDTSSTRLTVKEAELIFAQAMNSMENGNTSRAHDLYTTALLKLSDAKIDPAALFAVRNDFNAIFGKLEQLLADQEGTERSPGQKYAIPMAPENEVVRKYMKLYTQGEAKKTIEKALERSGRYRDMILAVLKEYDLPEELIYLPVVESLYNVHDRSSAGALGLWQLMPERARALGLKVNYWIDERKDPEKSTRAAARYLKELHLMFNDWHLALAAYNRGEYGLVRDLKFSKATNIEEFADRKAVPRETELYVPKFIACTLIGDNYERYGLTPAFEQPLMFDRVTTDKIVDLSVVAKCAGTDEKTIRALNPSLTAWCTPHNYPSFELHLPAGTGTAFTEKILTIKDEDLNPYQSIVRYKVRKGDTLSRIAKKFGTTVAALRSDNHLKKSQSLRRGQTLVVRPGKRSRTLAKAKKQ